MRFGALLAALLLPAAALAHHAPNSYVRLDFRASSVRVELMVPQSELAYAMDGTPSAATLPTYLLRHVGAATPQGVAWTARVAAVRATTYLEQPYFTAELVLTPPAGASARDFLFTNDAVTHEVRNHVVFIVAQSDDADGALAAAPQMLGVLQYPARQLAVRRPGVNNAADRRRARAPGT